VVASAITYNRGYNFNNQLATIGQLAIKENKMEKEKDYKNMCVECGNDTKLSSGRFVDRYPVDDSDEVNAESGRPFPKGRYCCAICNEKIEKNKG